MNDLTGHLEDRLPGGGVVGSARTGMATLVDLDGPQGRGQAEIHGNPMGTDEEFSALEFAALGLRSCIQCVTIVDQIVDAGWNSLHEQDSDSNCC